MRRRRPMLAWAGLAAIIATAVALLPPRTEAGPILFSEEAGREVFEQLARSESGWRLRAAQTFPNDNWSQDDDFHAHQRHGAQRLAAEHEVDVGAILRAFDQGLRAHTGDTAPLQGNVAACRPRLTY